MRDRQGGEAGAGSQGDPKGGPLDPGRVGTIGEPTSDSEAYQAFVQSLFNRANERLDTNLNDELQLEFANFVGLLAEMTKTSVLNNRILFEEAFHLLGAERPNLILVKGIRLELAIIHGKEARGLTRYVSFISGSTPLNAAISALLSAIVLSGIMVLAMLTGHRALLQSIAGTELFATLKDGSVALLIIAVHSAFVGGVVSILARIQDFLSHPTISPPLLYISIVRKPILAAAFVVLLYSVLKVGLISLPAISFTGPEAPYTAWALGFLCGFSERFAADFVQTASSKFGEAIPKGRSL